MKASIIIALLVVGGAGATWWLRDQADVPGATLVPRDGLFTVRRGALNVTLVENGTLVAKESRKIQPSLRGDSKITFLVDEGAEVEQGQVIVMLDADPSKEQLQQRELDVVQAQADLETAQTELEIQQTDNVSTIEKARIALEKAQQEEERYLDGDAPKERRNFIIAIEEARVAFTKREKIYNDSLMLREKDYVTQSQLEEDRINFEQAKVRLEGAEQDLALFEQYAFPMGKTERRVAVLDAERELDTAEKRARSQLRQKEVNVEQYSQRLASYQKQVAELKTDIENMTIVAPSPGIVIYGDPRRSWWRQDIRVGAEIWGNQTIMTIPDLRVMQVNIQVHEADVSKLGSGGQTAKITMDTYPGLVLDGDVTKIAALSSDNDEEVKKFDVEVTLRSAGDRELRPGISAKAEIFIERRDDVLYVPLQCVFLEEGRHWAYVFDGASVTRRSVEPGTTNDNYIEIRSGLAEGEDVLLYNPKVIGEGAGPDAAADAEADEDAVEADSAGDGEPAGDASRDTGAGRTPGGGDRPRGGRGGADAAVSRDADGLPRAAAATPEESAGRESAAGTTSAPELAVTAEATTAPELAVTPEPSAGHGAPNGSAAPAIQAAPAQTSGGAP